MLLPVQVVGLLAAIILVLVLAFKCTGPAEAQTGKASWYGPGFHGRPTASGERFNQNAATCAHRRLPFGSLVRVTNLKNGKSATCRVSDRGPFAGGRIIDVSKAVAGRLGMLRSGVARVRVEVLR